MRSTLKLMKQTQTTAIQVHNWNEVVPHMPGSVPVPPGTPQVRIQGDIQMRVTETDTMRRPVKGHYHLETEGMQEPLQVIWIIEGNVLNHTVNDIDVAFDVRGTSVGEILTRQLSAQVTEKNGQGCIVHSSVFVQIHVVSDTALEKTLR
jgi:hypothetical protein